MPIFLITNNVASSPGWVSNSAALTQCSESATEEQIEQAAAIASELLWQLSGGRFGLREITVRPYRLTCSRRREFTYPVISELCCGSRLIRLDERAEEIIEVKVNGGVVTDYRFYDHRMIVLDSQTFPCCQDLSLPDTDDGTWSITYTAGVPIPEGGKFAAQMYACELVKAMTNDGSCKLPQRVQTISRQGITVALLDPQEFLTSYRTGLPLVDAWLASINPKGYQSGGKVFNPDDYFFARES